MRLRFAVFVNLTLCYLLYQNRRGVLNNTVWEITDFLQLDGVISVGYDIAQSKIGKTIIYKNNKINIDNLSFNITKVSIEIVNE